MSGTLYDPADAVKMKPLGEEKYLDRAIKLAGMEDLARSTEVSGWGWLVWNGLEPGPQVPTEIGIAPPAASRMDRIAQRALVRRRPEPFLLSGRMVSASLTQLTATLATAMAAVPVGFGHFGAAGLSAATAVTYAVWQAPRLLTAWARRRLRVLTDAEDVAALAPLVALHRRVHAAACVEPVPDLEQADRLGHCMLWDLAGLLRETPSSSGGDVEGQVAEFRTAYAEAARQALEVRRAGEELTRVVEQVPHAAQPVDEAAVTEAENERALALQALADVSRDLAQVAISRRYAAQRLADQDGT